MLAPSAPVLSWNDNTLSVNNSRMDNTHKEFIELLNQCANASTDDFPALFTELVQHTQEHFELENKIMDASEFPPTPIHQGEHARILTEIETLDTQVKLGEITAAQKYIRNYIPDWFCNHAATMDRALARHLKSRGMENSF
ncbi:MAG: hemerythrin domain-containing protein [Gammaproteobacteria bacterium]|nr:hemerythrin domain-containing protein [Gammaproteobacteria bacterium]